MGVSISVIKKDGTKKTVFEYSNTRHAITMLEIAKTPECYELISCGNEGFLSRENCEFISNFCKHEKWKELLMLGAENNGLYID